MCTNSTLHRTRIHKYVYKFYLCKKNYFPVNKIIVVKQILVHVFMEIMKIQIKTYLVHRTTQIIYVPYLCG